MREDIIVNPAVQKLAPQIVEKLETIVDPEIELDIYNLGLIYQIELSEEGHCHLIMTFTSAGCGCIGTVPQEIQEKLQELAEIKRVSVEIVWQPVWKLTRISRVGRIFLGINPN